MGLECVRGQNTDQYIVRHDGTGVGLPSATVPAAFTNTAARVSYTAGSNQITFENNAFTAADDDVFVADTNVYFTQDNRNYAVRLDRAATFSAGNITFTGRITPDDASISSQSYTNFQMALQAERAGPTEWASISFPNKAGNGFGTIADADLIEVTGNVVKFGSFFDNKYIVLGTEDNTVTSGTGVKRNGRTLFEVAYMTFITASNNPPVISDNGGDANYGESVSGQSVGDVNFLCEGLRGTGAASGSMFNYPTPTTGNGPTLLIREGARISGPVGQTATSRQSGPFWNYSVINNPPGTGARNAFMGDGQVAGLNLNFISNRQERFIPTMNFRTEADVTVRHIFDDATVAIQQYGDSDNYFQPTGTTSRVFGFNLDGLTFAGGGDGNLLFRDFNGANGDANLTPVFNNFVAALGGTMRHGMNGNNTASSTTSPNYTVSSTFLSPVGIDLDSTLTALGNPGAFSQSTTLGAGNRCTFNVDLNFPNVDPLGNALTGVTSRIETRNLAFSANTSAGNFGYGNPTKTSTRTVNVDSTGTGWTTNANTNTYRWNKRLQAKNSFDGTARANGHVDDPSTLVINDDIVHRHYRWDRDVITNSTLTSSGVSGAITTQNVFNPDNYVQTSGTTVPTTLTIDSINKVYDYFKKEWLDNFDTTTTELVDATETTLDLTGSESAVQDISFVESGTNTSLVASDGTVGTSATIVAPNGIPIWASPTTGKIALDGLKLRNLSFEDQPHPAYTMEPTGTFTAGDGDFTGTTLDVGVSATIGNGSLNNVTLTSPTVTTGTGTFTDCTIVATTSLTGSSGQVNGTATSPTINYGTGSLSGTASAVPGNAGSIVPLLTATGGISDSATATGWAGIGTGLVNTTGDVSATTGITATGKQNTGSLTAQTINLGTGTHSNGTGTATTQYSLGTQTGGTIVTGDYNVSVDITGGTFTGSGSNSDVNVANDISGTATGGNWTTVTVGGDVSTSGNVTATTSATVTGDKSGTGTLTAPTITLTGNHTAGTSVATTAYTAGGQSGGTASSNAVDYGDTGPISGGTARGTGTNPTLNAGGITANATLEDFANVDLNNGGIAGNSTSVTATDTVTAGDGQDAGTVTCATAEYGTGTIDGGDLTATDEVNAGGQSAGTVRSNDIGYGNSTVVTGGTAIGTGTGAVYRAGGIGNSTSISGFRTVNLNGGSIAGASTSIVTTAESTSQVSAGAGQSAGAVSTRIFNYVGADYTGGTITGIGTSPFIACRNMSGPSATGLAAVSATGTISGTTVTGTGTGNLLATGILGNATVTAYTGVNLGAGSISGLGTSITGITGPVIATGGQSGGTLTTTSSVNYGTGDLTAGTVTAGTTIAVRNISGASTAVVCPRINLTGTIRDAALTTSDGVYRTVSRTTPYAFADVRANAVIRDASFTADGSIVITPSGTDAVYVAFDNVTFPTDVTITVENGSTGDSPEVFVQGLEEAQLGTGVSRYVYPLDTTAARINISLLPNDSEIIIQENTTAGATEITAHTKVSTDTNLVISTAAISGVTSTIVAGLGTTVSSLTVSFSHPRYQERTWNFRVLQNANRVDQMLPQAYVDFDPTGLVDQSNNIVTGLTLGDKQIVVRATDVGASDNIHADRNGNAIPRNSQAVFDVDGTANNFASGDEVNQMMSEARGTRAYLRACRRKLGTVFVDSANAYDFFVPRGSLGVDYRASDAMVFTDNAEPGIQELQGAYRTSGTDFTDFPDVRDSVDIPTIQEGTGTSLNKTVIATQRPNDPGPTAEAVVAGMATELDRRGATLPTFENLAEFIPDVVTKQPD